MGDDGSETDEVVARPLDRGSETATDSGSGRLSALTLHDFADQVGQPLPGAGGGSVVAYAGSMAAALVDMVCRLTVDAKRNEDADEELRSTCASAASLTAKLLFAVDADADAYLDVVGAHRLPKDTLKQKATRDAAISAATRRAAEVPLASAEACLEVLELTRHLSADFMTAAASELGVAAQAALMGVRGAAVNVAINLRHLGGDPAAEQIRRRMAEVERCAEHAFAAVWPTLRDLSGGTS